MIPALECLCNVSLALKMAFITWRLAEMKVYFSLLCDV